MTETEKKLLLELARWVVEEDRAYKPNPYTVNIKELAAEIIKKDIRECENAPQQTPFDMVAFANGLFDRKETTDDQGKE